MSNNIMNLSQEQQLAYNKYKEGKNIFITGPGGSGKSELIRYIYKDAKSKFKEIQVTALTGCAAVLLNCKAKTLHSWAGIGLGNKPVQELVRYIRKRKVCCSTWKDTDILIIDEVSMLSLDLFEKLNIIGQTIRCCTLPFGGIQLIFSGDFYQLPPVGKHDEPKTQQFCFESPIWENTFNISCQIEFKKIFRQTEQVYSSILNQLRDGKIKRSSIDILSQYIGREVSPDLITKPTRLYPTKNKVEQINITEMNKLTTVEQKYELKYITDLEVTPQESNIRAQFTGQQIEQELDFLAGNLMCDKNYKLKIGSQVMCIVNIRSETGDILICNGSQGIVTAFCPTTNCPIVKFNNKVVRIMTPNIWESDHIPGIGVSQVPLILAWALTIHKSQGSTLDAAEIDIGTGIFECGQTYVALSRVKCLDGLYLTAFDPSRIKIDKKVKAYYEQLRLHTSNIPQLTLETEQITHDAITSYIPIATPVTDINNNQFTQYAYAEAVISVSAIEANNDTTNNGVNIITVNNTNNDATNNAVNTITINNTNNDANAIANNNTNIKVIKLK